MLETDDLSQTLTSIEISSTFSSFNDLLLYTERLGFFSLALELARASSSANSILSA